MHSFAPDDTVSDDVSRDASDIATVKCNSLIYCIDRMSPRLTVRTPPRIIGWVSHRQSTVAQAL